MNLALGELIVAGPSQEVAFESGGSGSTPIGQTITALLNAEGGTVLVGVDAAEKIVGVENASTTVEELQARALGEDLPTRCLVGRGGRA